MADQQRPPNNGSGDDELEQVAEQIERNATSEIPAADQPTTALPQVSPAADPPAYEELPPAEAMAPPAGGGEPPYEPPPGGQPPIPPGGGGIDRWILGGIIGLAVIVLMGAIYLFALKDDDDTAAEATATIEAPTATLEATVEPTATEPEATATEEPTNTPEPTATDEPEPTATLEPTATPEEPTATPTVEPTATPTEPAPEPTKTPVPDTPTPTPEPEPTATDVPSAPTPEAGVEVYRANWSDGDGGWTLAEGWDVENGNLVANGAESGAVLAAFQPTGENYAVEAQMAIIGSNDCSEIVGLIVRAALPQDAEASAASGIVGGACAHEWQIARVNNGNRDTLANGYRPLNDQMHTYRLEVDDDDVLLFIDGKFITELDDVAMAAQGRTGIYLNGQVRAVVQSFVVYSLDN
ncbi:MAG: hypothetical protein M9890_13090 [Thermomicrobiales bacterium]|nr:hypothetical protein [Thermomicrobiales bacterium]